MSKAVLAWHPRLVWLTTGGHCCPTGIVNTLSNQPRKCLYRFLFQHLKQERHLKDNLGSVHLTSAQSVLQRGNRREGLFPQDRTFNKLNSLDQKERKTFQRLANSCSFTSYLITKQALSRWTRKVYLAKQNDTGDLRQRKSSFLMQSNPSSSKILNHFMIHRVCKEKRRPPH